MIRADIISVVGREYLTSNIENDEYRGDREIQTDEMVLQQMKWYYK